jgi:calcineurin-like phosphoesterase family protein
MMLGKPIFFTSDWHLGHDKALEYDKRPFRNMDHMCESLITRFNATVPENGITYFLGDMGNKPEDIRKVINRLNGTKVLILGNHDHGMGTMYNCGFDVVVWGAYIYIGDVKVTITHCPLIGVWREDTSQMKSGIKLAEKGIVENWHGESRPKHFRHAIKDEGQYHLHGHIHSRKDKPLSQKILGRQYDVGVTANDYRPVSLSEITSWVMKSENKVREENNPDEKSKGRSRGQ